MLKKYLITGYKNLITNYKFEVEIEAESEDDAEERVIDEIDELEFNNKLNYIIPPYDEEPLQSIEICNITEIE